MSTQTISRKMPRVEVNNKYTYKTAEKVKVGDQVLLPSADWVASASGCSSWQGTVTSLSSAWDGPCATIIEVLPKEEGVQS